MAKRATLRKTQVLSETWKVQGKRRRQEMLVVRDERGRFDGSRLNVTSQVNSLLGK